MITSEQKQYVQSILWAHEQDPEHEGRRLAHTAKALSYGHCISEWPSHSAEEARAHGVEILNSANAHDMAKYVVPREMLPNHEGLYCADLVPGADPVEFARLKEEFLARFR